MNELKPHIRSVAGYATDFAAWTSDQARRLRTLKPDGLDWENLAEEVESLGRSDRRALGSALKVVLEHLIKWRYQPSKRSDSWRDSIDEHRDRIVRILEDSPSLAGFPKEVLDREYLRARLKALRDSKLAATRIPTKCPFALAEVLDIDFLPDEEDASPAKPRR